jgi:hypothetical protein
VVLQWNYSVVTVDHLCGKQNILSKTLCAFPRQHCPWWCFLCACICKCSIIEFLALTERECDKLSVCERGERGERGEESDRKLPAAVQKLSWCYNSVTLMLPRCYRGVTVLLQLCNSDVTVVLHLCRGIHPLLCKTVWLKEPSSIWESKQTCSSPVLYVTGRFQGVSKHMI